jgi:hypothetical protein
MLAERLVDKPLRPRVVQRPLGGTALFGLRFPK